MQKVSAVLYGQRVMVDSDQQQLISRKELLISAAMQIKNNTLIPAVEQFKLLTDIVSEIRCINKKIKLNIIFVK
jgi:hypothetical protein